MLRRILLLFLASGALGLGYQVLWSKLVLLFVGVSSWSYAIVLAAFMAGLALGSRFLGPVADRVRSPLALFGWLELGVGAYAIAYPMLSDAAGRLYLRLAASSAQSTEPGDWRPLVLKACVAGALLVPPTFLMGGTYPALLRHASLQLGSVGRRASQLYAVNAAGAVAGSLLMAMVLLPALGVRSSLLLLALGNALVGALALAGSRRAATADRDADAARDELTDALDPTLVPLAALATAVAFVAGFLSFTLEVAWTRAFAVVTGSSTQSFAVILAAFITGIAGGSALLSRWEHRVRRPVALFGAAQIATAVLVVLPLPLVPFMPWALGRLARDLPATDAGYHAWGALKLGACLAVMLLPCFGMGLSIPLAVKAVARSAGRLGAQAGRVYAFNTLGNVLGALVCGLVLLPLLGVERLIESCAVALAIFGAVALVAGGPREGASRRAALAGAGAGLTVALALALPPWNAAWMSVTSFRRSQVVSWEETRRGVAAMDVVSMKDDPAANIIVAEGRGSVERAEGRAAQARSEDRVLFLLVNGKPDASSQGDQPTQLLLAHLPLLLKPDAKSVLVIGLATGITSGAALRHPIERLDVVDVVRSMPEAAAHFDAWSGRPLDDPRTRFIADDARSWLMSTTDVHDVVISEPSNPWTAGTGSLFSTDFYREASRRLSPDGLYVQWLQAYELSDENLAAILRSFRTVFPHVTLWETASLDVLLVGSRLPLAPDRERLREAMARPRVREQLATLGIERPDDLLFLQRFTEPGVDWIAAASELQNTDDNLLLEHEAPRDLFLLRSPSLLQSVDERRSVSPGLGWTPGLREPHADALALPRLMSGRVFGNAELHASWLRAADRLAGTPREGSLSHEQVVTAVRAARSDPARLAPLLSQERTSILVVAASSAEWAELWQAELATLASRATGRAATLLRLLRVDVLASSSRLAEAQAALSDVEAAEPPPSVEEILLRACRIDAGAGCTQAAQRLLARTGDERLRRFVELRR